MTNETRNAPVRNEHKVIGMIVDAAVAAGYKVSVHDGEEVTVSQSTDKAEIIGACMTTGRDNLIMTNEGERVGAVTLVYGNGADCIDLIADYSVSLEGFISPITDKIDAQVFE